MNLENKNDFINRIIGCPFKNGGENLDGFDCFGLVHYVYKNLYNIEIPDYNHMNVDAMDSKIVFNIYNNKKSEWQWERIDKPQEPCVIAIRNDYNYPDLVNHVGIYIGNGKFLQCLAKVGVILSDINNKYWKRKIEGFYKWIGKRGDL